MIASASEVRGRPSTPRPEPAGAPPSAPVPINPCPGPARPGNFPSMGTTSCVLLSVSSTTSSVRALTMANHPLPDLTSTFSHNHGLAAERRVWDALLAEERVWSGGVGSGGYG